MSPRQSSCAHEQPCIRIECLKQCLVRFIPSVVDYLRRRRIKQDIAIEAASAASEKAVRWIIEGKAAQMTSERRRSYLCRTAFYIACDLIRRQARSPLGKAVSLSNPDCGYQPAGGVDPFKEAAQAEEVALLRECLDTLEDDDQCLVELYYCDDATFAQLADLLGCSESTAWRRVQAAFNRLTGIIHARLKARKFFGRRAS